MKLARQTTGGQSVYLKAVDQIVRVYDEKGIQLHQWGQRDPGGNVLFSGYPYHIFPIPDHTRKLYFYFESDHINIGIVGTVRIGKPAVLLRNILLQDLDRFAVAVLITSIGLIFLVSRFFRAGRTLFAGLGLFALATGVYLITRTQLKQLVLDAPLFWIYLEVWSLSLVPAGLYGFLQGLVVRGPWQKLLRSAQWLHLGYALLFPLLALSGKVALMSTLLPVQIGLGFQIIILLIWTISSFRKNTEARIMGIAFIFPSATTVHDVLAAVGIIPWGDTLTHYGMLLFTGGLVAIIVRRNIMTQISLAESNRERAQLLLTLEEKVIERTAKLNLSQGRLEKLTRFSRKINEQARLNRIVGQVLEFSHKEYGVEAVALWLVDEAANTISVSELDFTEELEIDPEKLATVNALQFALTPETGALFIVYSRRRHLYMSRIPKTDLTEIDQIVVESMGLKSFLNVPLIVEGKVIGILGLTTYQSRLKIDRSEINNLLQMSEHVAGSVHSAILLQESEHQRDKLARLKRLTDRELGMAREIQHQLMPVNPPGIKGGVISVSYISLEEVGGDFIDIENLENDQTAILVADASGHGVPAALVAAMTKIAIDSAQDFRGNPVEVLRAVNRSLLGRTNHNFITACYAIYDARDRSLRYAGAGHPPVYRLVPGRPARSLKAGGQILGIFDKPRISEYNVQLDSGDRLIFFSDGIQECRDPSGNELQEEQLVSLFTGLNHWTEHYTDRLIEELRVFMGRARFEDDVTVISLLIE